MFCNSSSFVNAITNLCTNNVFRVSHTPSTQPIMPREIYVWLPINMSIIISPLIRMNATPNWKTLKSRYFCATAGCDALPTLYYCAVYLTPFLRSTFTGYTHPTLKTTFVFSGSCLFHAIT